MKALPLTMTSLPISFPVNKAFAARIVSQSLSTARSMKNRLSSLLLVAGLISLTGPALHGSELVNRCWPMHDRDYREYDGRLGPTTNLLLAAQAWFDTFTP
jgi:hypothetical protein